MSTSEAVVIWGEVLWDRFPDGDQLGGAPANVAWHLGQAGGWARLVTRVGNDLPGRRAITQLEEFVDVSLVQLDRDRETGEVGIEVVAGEPRYTLHPGRAWERIECTDAARIAIAEAGVLVYGTLSQRTPEGLAGWRAAIEAAGDRCTKVCDVNLRRKPGSELEPAERVVLGEALDAADIIKVNDKELAVIAAWREWADPIAELCAHRRAVVITHGAGGSTLYSDRQKIFIPSVHAALGGDNVGCGDAYVAILVHGLTMGWDLSLSARAASRWAAAVAGARGATPRFDDETIEALLEDA